jgi:hypothetical protein
MKIALCYTEGMSENARKPVGHTNAKTTYIVVGVVAAVVSAATVAYFFYKRSQDASLKMKNVEELLDRSHELVGEIHRRLGDLTSAATSASTTAV